MPADTTAPMTPFAATERAERGKAARSHASRSSQGSWEAPVDRPDPVAVLEAQSASRLPELVPIRYGRMRASPFSFYRGGAAVMAADLAGTAVSGIEVQLCGDAHCSNFGIYAAPDRRLVLDLNDFDETHRGPWEWDIKRLVASLEVAGRDRGFKPRQRRTIVRAAAREYREAIRRFATMGNLAVWYARLDVEELLEDLQGRVADRAIREARRTTAKAAAKDSLRAISKLTERVGDELRFVSDPPLVVRISDLLEDEQADALQGQIYRLLELYRQSLAPEVAHLVSCYETLDLARKVVGVGSVGTRAWIVLLRGLDDGDPLVLQAKEAQASVLEPHAGDSPYANQGERVVHGQRFMQAASDILLGWQHVTGIDGQERDFYVRQLWDGKGSAKVDTMPAERMVIYGQLCGWTLARAHARSGDRVALAAYLGTSDKFDRALIEFADAYADQNELDFRALCQAIENGRLVATSGL